MYIERVLCNDYYILTAESGDNVSYSLERFFFVGRGERKLKVRESIGNSERMDDLIETRNVITRYLCIENKIVFASRENGECPSNNINMYIYISLGFSFSVNNEFRIE